MTEQICSAVILTALGLEREALLAHVEDQRQVEQSGTVYDMGVLRCDRDLQVAVAEIGAGNVETGVHVERAQNLFAPDLVVFVGVAGGVKDVSHGDVVVASKVYGYESGKADGEFLTRPEALRLNHRIEQHARQIINAGDWQSRLHSDGHDPPKAVLGPIAAGEALVSSTGSEIYERIKRSYNDTVAVEMEGRGLFVGAHLNSPLPALVVRGISDLIDDKDAESDESRQPVAAANAAAFTVELLCQLAGKPSPIELGTQSDLKAITGSLENAYYLNVDRLISDPSVLQLFDGWVNESIRGIRSWEELDFPASFKLRKLCEAAIERWDGVALPLEAAVEAEEVGSRIVFDGFVRTRNWQKSDPEVGITGDFEIDPHIYIDAGGRRVLMLIDPRWVTSATGKGAFQRGGISMSGVALLRDVDEASALASPYVLAPPVNGRRLTRQIFGD